MLYINQYYYFECTYLLIILKVNWVKLRSTKRVPNILHNKAANEHFPVASTCLRQAFSKRLEQRSDLQDFTIS